MRRHEWSAEQSCLFLFFQCSTPSHCAHGNTVGWRWPRCAKQEPFTHRHRVTAYSHRLLNGLAVPLNSVPTPSGQEHIFWTVRLVANKTKHVDPNAHLDGRGKTTLTRPYDPLMSSEISDATGNDQMLHLQLKLISAGARHPTNMFACVCAHDRLSMIKHIGTKLDVKASQGTGA